MIKYLPLNLKNNEGNLETRECDEVLIFHGLKNGTWTNK